MSEDRWQTLSQLYGIMRQTFQDDYHRASMLARSLKIQLISRLGCPPASVVLFDYDEQTYAYEPEDSPFQAVSMNNDYVWFLGFGVTLERAPNAYPKTTFQFPVWFHFHGATTEVDTSFGKFTLLPGDTPDFTEACEAICQGLKNALINRTNKKANDKKFGFLSFDNE